MNSRMTLNLRKTKKADLIWISFILIFIFLAFQNFKSADNFFKYVVPGEDVSKNITDLSRLNGVIDEDHRVKIGVDGHFYVRGKQTRFIGMNITAGGGTPTHEESEKIAARLAHLGVNLVRMHHLDSSMSPRGFFLGTRVAKCGGGQIPISTDGLTLDPAQMDKFDYLVSELKKNGIYIDLNLHVGSQYGNYAGIIEGLCDKWSVKQWKGVDIFYEEFIEKQKRYAELLLNRVNKYTSLAYKDDPAVAWIEINNENGLYLAWQRGYLDSMTDPYLGVMTEKWNKFLKKRQLKWNDLYSNVQTFPVSNISPTFNLEQNDPVVATLTKEFDPILKQDVQVQTITNRGAISWSTQLHILLNKKLEPSKQYQLKLKIKSDTALNGRNLNISAGLSVAPFSKLAIKKVLLSEAWNEFVLDFTSSDDLSNVRLTLNGVGDRTGRLYIAETRLTEDGNTFPVSDWILQIRKDFALATLQNDYFDSELGKNVTLQQITTPGSLDSSVRVFQENLKFKAYVPNRYEIQLKSDLENAKVQIVAQTGDLDAKVIWSETIVVNRNWQNFSFQFVPLTNESSARIAIFGMGDQQSKLYIADAKLTQGGELNQDLPVNWSLYLNPDSTVRGSYSEKKLEISASAQNSWSATLVKNKLPMRKSIPYEIKFKLRADVEFSRLHLNARKQNSKILWVKKLPKLIPNQDYEFSFLIWPSEDDDNGSINLTGFADQVGQIQISEASLRWKVPPNVTDPGFIKSSNLNDYPYDIQTAWIQFLFDEEISYWKEMKDFLNNDLKVKALLVGSQQSFSPAQIQNTFDILDNHAYWNHPIFPRVPFDGTDWYNQNQPMAGMAVNGLDTLSYLASQRVAGKPYVISEYNHASPSFFDAEMIPTIAAYAAFQDWDAFIISTYGLSFTDDSWKNVLQEDFFEIRNNPVKISALVSAAKIFREGHVLPSLSASRLKNSNPVPPLDNFIPTMIMGLDKKLPNAQQMGVSWNEFLYHAVDIGSKPMDKKLNYPILSDTEELKWGINDNRAFSINTPKTKGIVGNAGGVQILTDVSMNIYSAENDWGVLLLSIIEGQNFSSQGRFLVTVLGQMKNSTQVWNESFNSLINITNSRGNKVAAWTSLPKRIDEFPVVEAVKAAITLPVNLGRIRVWALDPAGNRSAELSKSEIKSEVSGRTTIVFIRKALWYEIEVQ